MATAAERVMTAPKKRVKIRRGPPPRLLVVHGGKELPAEQGNALIRELSERLDARRLQGRLERLNKRHGHTPERLSVEKAMLAVEEKIVKAYWVLARLPDDKGLGYARRNGLDYMMDRADKWAEAVAGGGWLSRPPRPGPPSAEAIDAMHKPLEWLCWLEYSDARVLAAGAIWKRGDAGRNVNWVRVKGSRRELANFTVDQLKVKYRQALRTIVAELTARAGENIALERNTN